MSLVILDERDIDACERRVLAAFSYEHEVAAFVALRASARKLEVTEDLVDAALDAHDNVYEPGAARAAMHAALSAAFAELRGAP